MPARCAQRNQAALGHRAPGPARCEQRLRVGRRMLAQSHPSRPYSCRSRRRRTLCRRRPRTCRRARSCGLSLTTRMRHCSARQASTYRSAPPSARCPSTCHGALLVGASARRIVRCWPQRHSGRSSIFSCSAIAGTRSRRARRLPGAQARCPKGSCPRAPHPGHGCPSVSHRPPRCRHRSRRGRHRRRDSLQTASIWPQAAPRR